VEQETWAGGRRDWASGSRITGPWVDWTKGEKRTRSGGAGLGQVNRDWVRGNRAGPGGAGTLPAEQDWARGSKAALRDVWTPYSCRR
jgi:hypothetical protein